MAVEVVFETFHGLGRGGFEWGVGRGVEADEVDTAIKPLEQAYQFGGMAGVVVEPFEHSVFEGDAPLAAPVILPEQGHHIGYGVGFLHGHDVQPFGSEGVVQADGYVALALVEKTAQPRDDAHSGDRDAVGTPSKSPRGSEHLGATEHVVQIIHGFAHTHIYYISEAVKFGDGENLVQDFRGV